MIRRLLFSKLHCGSLTCNHVIIRQLYDVTSEAFKIWISRFSPLADLSFNSTSQFAEESIQTVGRTYTLITTGSLTL